jgi:diguanylate cyclase (GGDEF)-like protein
MGEREALLARLAQLEERNRRLEILYETAKDLSSALQVGEVLDRLLGRVLQTIRADAGCIFIYEEAENVLSLRSSRGLRWRRSDRFQIPLGGGVSGWVGERREAVMTPDVNEDARFVLRDIERDITGAVLSIPLVVREILTGVMTVSRDEGAQPFMPEDLELLVAIASHAAVEIENAKLHEESVALRYLDVVTRLCNYTTFQKTLLREIERADRYSRTLSVVLMDVDDFKRYNDQYGSARGDEALRGVADLIRAQSRSSDTVSRTGADQFAVILPETEAKNASLFAEKVRESIAAHSFPGPPGDVPERLTVSIGIASFPSDACTAVDLLDIAESALFESKFSGKNRVSGIEDI